MRVQDLVQTRTHSVPSVTAQSRIDYDLDDDNFIEISHFDQLNAVRYDLDTDGSPISSNASDYNDAFPRAMSGMGCASDCKGYEILADMPMDVAEENWEPIGTDLAPFTGWIKGNGNLIIKLTIDRESLDQVGLFGSTAAGSIIEGFALTDPKVKGGEDVGALVGKNSGTVRNSFAVVRPNLPRNIVEGTTNVGGLVGSMASGGAVSSSYARLTVYASSDGAGGLIGRNAGGSCVNSYYSGDVDSAGSTQGLVVGTHSSGTYSECMGDSTTDNSTNDSDEPTVDAAGSGTATGASVNSFDDMVTPDQSFPYLTPYGDWDIDIDGDKTLDSPWYFGDGRTVQCRAHLVYIPANPPTQPTAAWVPQQRCETLGDLPVLQFDGHNPQLQHNLMTPKTQVIDPAAAGVGLLLPYTVNLCERTIAVANELIRLLKEVESGVLPATQALTDCTAHSDVRRVLTSELFLIGRNRDEVIDLRDKSLRELKPGDFNNLTGYPLRIYLNGTGTPTSNRFDTLPSRLFEGVMIEHLDLSNNGITHLPWDLFGTNPRGANGECPANAPQDLDCFFSSVYLNDNWLTENGLPPTIFDSLIHLNALRLDNNLMDKVNTRWFQRLAQLGKRDSSQTTDLRPYAGLYLHGNSIRSYHFDTGSGLSKAVYSTIFTSEADLKSEIEWRIESGTLIGSAPNLNFDATDYWNSRASVSMVDPDLSNADADERVSATAGTSLTRADGSTYTLTDTLYDGRYQSSCGSLTSRATTEYNYVSTDCYIIPHYSSPHIQTIRLFETCDGTRQPIIVESIYIEMGVTTECPSAASNGVVTDTKLWQVRELDFSFSDPPLAALRPGDFHGLAGLDMLWLDVNALTTEGIPPTVFDEVPNLVGLFLSENQLLHINTRWFEKLTRLGARAGEGLGSNDGGLNLDTQLADDGVTPTEVRTFYYREEPGLPEAGDPSRIEYYDKEQLRLEIERVIIRGAGGVRPSTLNISPERYLSGYFWRTLYAGPEPYYAAAAPQPLSVTAPGGRQSIQVTFLHRPRADADDPSKIHQVARYEYRYRVRPSDPSERWTATWRTATLSGLDQEGEQTITIHGLEPSTVYQVQIRAISGEERGRSSVIATITSGTLINLPEINRIESTITGLTVQAGSEIRLEVNVYGLADRLDNSIPDVDGSNLFFSWTETPAIGGRFADPNDGRRVTYTAPSLPGQYQITAEASPTGICRSHHASPFGISEEDSAPCIATFNVRVTRAPSYTTETADPINPAGLIPSSLTDDAGTAYAVFTPVEGGTFTGEGITVTARPGAVPDRELLGVSAMVSSIPLPESGPTSRFTVSGSFYEINGVQRNGEAPVSGYRLDAPLSVCLPLPDAFRGYVSNIVMVERKATGTLGVLGSTVRVTDGVLSACGSVSQLPATLAVARLGAPEPVAPEATPSPGDLPDTGATAPGAGNAIIALVLGFLTLAGSVGATVGAVRRRPS